MKIARFANTDLFLIEAEGKTYGLNVETESAGTVNPPIGTKEDRILFDDTPTPEPEHPTLEHREGEYVHYRIISDFYIEFVDGAWVFPGDIARGYGASMSKAQMDETVRDCTVLSHGFLNGKVTTDWKVGDVVPAGTSLDRMWLGRRRKGDYPLVWGEGERTGYDREILWIEDSK